MYYDYMYSYVFMILLKVLKYSTMLHVHVFHVEVAYCFPTLHGGNGQGLLASYKNEFYFLL